MTLQSKASDWQRAWLSVWLVIHFFILAICLVQNNGASFLIKRIQQLTSAYSIALQQDYGARPLEMQTGLSRSWPHQLQIHQRHATADQWLPFQPVNLPMVQQFDMRWKNFQHMLAVAATEENEELVYVIFHKIARRMIAEGVDIDVVRLVRPATLSFAQDKQYRDGLLPAEALEDTVLYEARVVSLPENEIRLLPVLQRMRRAVSLEKTP